MQPLLLSACSGLLLQQGARSPGIKNPQCSQAKGSLNEVRVRAWLLAADHRRPSPSRGVLQPKCIRKSGVKLCKSIISTAFKVTLRGAECIPSGG